MGKSKKRIFNKNTETGLVLKRTKAVSEVMFSINNNKITEETKRYISLFGISIEELLEAGAEFEKISAVKSLFIC